MRDSVIMIVCLMLVLVAGLWAQQSSTSSAKENPVEITSGFIDVPDGKLFYEAAGQGNVIVLIHDGMLHRETWDSQFTEFARDHRVVRYDRRGYGHSPKADKPHSNVEDLKAVFDQLKIDSAVVMGGSAGGGLVIDFTLKYPQKVTAIVLVGAVVSGYGYTNHMYSRGGHFTAADMADLAGAITYWAEKDPYETYAENTAAKKRVRQLLEQNPQDFEEQGAMVLPPDRPALGNLHEIKVPALVVVGEYDHPDVHAHSGVIETGIPGAERIIINKAGHLAHMEQPQEFNTQVQSFLQSAPFFRALRTSGANEAVNVYHRIRAADLDAVLFTEARLNMIAYQYLQNGDIDAALALFRLNIETYPRSANVYDSYGEALLAKGDTASAIINYQKSLHLNPENTDAVQVLKKLGAK